MTSYACTSQIQLLQKGLYTFCYKLKVSDYPHEGVKVFANDLIYAAKPWIKGVFRIRLSNIENPYVKFTHVKSGRC